LFLLRPYGSIKNTSEKSGVVYSVKKQRSRASGRKKKSLIGGVTEKSGFVFVDKIEPETKNVSPKTNIIPI
jgi:hypothetical protein